MKKEIGASYRVLLSIEIMGIRLVLDKRYATHYTKQSFIKAATEQLQEYKSSNTDKKI